MSIHVKEEELDKHRIQVSPPGFHVFYLPYADDIRQVDKQIVAKRKFTL